MGHEYALKTIDIEGKEWWDSANGNHYFSAQVTVNFGLEDAATYRIPYDYGYGDQYVYAALTELKAQGILPQDWTDLTVSRCKAVGIILRKHKKEHCTKKEIIAWGKE